MHTGVKNRVGKEGKQYKASQLKCTLYESEHAEITARYGANTAPPCWAVSTMSRPLARTRPSLDNSESHVLCSSDMAVMTRMRLWGGTKAKLRLQAGSQKATVPDAAGPAVVHLQLRKSI